MSKITNKYAVTSLVFIAGLFHGALFADQFHYKNLIVGERASGLGGAYTAVSDDPSGLYYNPAGIVYAQSTSLSASVNAYHTSETTFENALAGQDWKRTSSAFLPNFFAVIQPMGPGMVGFSYAVPDSVRENQDQEFLNPNPAWDRLTVNYNDEDQTYKIGPSYAIEITKGLSVGATLYLHFRERERIINQVAVNTLGEHQLSNSYFQTRESGYQPMLGVMWNPFRKISLGLNITKTIITGSKAETQTTQKAFTDSIFQQQTVKISDKREMPTIFSLGAAYFPTSKLMISGDLYHYTATEDAITGTRDAITNFAFGAEYYMTGSLVLRGGIFSNYANTPGLVEGQTGQNPHINFYGTSLSLSNVTRNSTVTLGVIYSIGSGLAQVVEGSTELTDASASTLSVLLSTSYSY